MFICICLLLTGEEPRTKGVSRKSGITFKTKRKSAGKDRTPQSGKRNSSGRRSYRKSPNHTERKKAIAETKGNMHNILSVKKTKEETNSCRRSTFDITDGEITIGKMDCYTSVSYTHLLHKIPSHFSNFTFLLDIIISNQINLFKFCSNNTINLSPLPKIHTDVNLHHLFQLI